MSNSPPLTALSETTSRFQLMARTQQEEDSFDYAAIRNINKPTGVIGSIAHLVKGALGAGILSGHVSYMLAGIYVAVSLNIVFGIYITYCLYLLVYSAQIMYRRTRVVHMTYSDLGEATLACHPNPKVQRFSKTFRYIIDVVIMIDLFGSCACYQIIIAKSIKQLVENTHKTSIDGLNASYPNLRVYLAALIIPIILICLIMYLKWLAPFSLAANFVILICIGMAVYYAFVFNPSFSNMVPYTSPYSVVQFLGMAVFSMSCAGVVLPVENNMRNPAKFPLVLVCAMTIIILCVFCVAFFGYAAFLDKSESPITVNFPMELFPKILKGGIVVMIYVTHALNFWIPFDLAFHYLKKRHNPNKHLQWELIYRALIVLIIAIVAIIFPNINSIMGFLGAFCLSNMAFVWPHLIYILVIQQRPGFGKYKWRLWQSLFLLGVGLVLLFCGSVINFIELLSIFKK